MVVLERLRTFCHEGDKVCKQVLDYLFVSSYLYCLQNPIKSRRRKTGYRAPYGCSWYLKAGKNNPGAQEGVQQHTVLTLSACVPETLCDNWISSQWITLH